MKISPTTLTVGQLFSQMSEQYVVPAYQRRYSWHEKQVQELVDDIVALEDGETHLLGSIVCLASAHTAGLNRLELVDGQQRLTTIAVLIYCLKQFFQRRGLESEAAELDRMVVSKALGGETQPKVLLDSLDAPQFRSLSENRPPSTGTNTNLEAAFRMFESRLMEMREDDVARFVYRLQNHTLIIRLDVSDATDAHKLFETINNRGLKLSPPDILKNFILGNAAKYSRRDLEMAREVWASLLSILDGLSLESFFRAFMVATLNRRVTRSFVIPYFKQYYRAMVDEARHDTSLHRNYSDEDEEADELEADVIPNLEIKGDRLSFQQFLESVLRFARSYGQVLNCSTPDASLNAGLRSLHLVGSVTAHPFLSAIWSRGIGSREMKEIVDMTSVVLLRRHTCRERTSDNERLFASICDLKGSNLIPGFQKSALRYYPSDETFARMFASATYPSNSLNRARYCLERIEHYKRGDTGELAVVGGTSVHLEHIIPLKIRTAKSRAEYGDWASYLGTESESLHPEYVSRIGNLTLIAGSMNIAASNNPFHSKSGFYRQSDIVITRELAENYTDFNFDSVTERSKEMASLAVSLWRIDF